MCIPEKKAGGSFLKSGVAIEDCRHRVGVRWVMAEIFTRRSACVSLASTT
jgi:hypothetical protein